MKLRYRFFYCFWIVCAVLASSSWVQAQQNTFVHDGFYLVTEPGLEQFDIRPKNTDEKLVQFDKRFLDTTVVAYTKFIVTTKEYVSLKLKELPEPVKQPNDRQNVVLPLVESSGKQLFEFTKQNTGKMLAIIIGGQVVSVYTIKGPINGGVVQIGRCTKQATNFLLSALQKDIQQGK